MFNSRNLVLNYQCKGHDENDNSVSIISRDVCRRIRDMWLYLKKNTNQIFLADKIFVLTDEMYAVYEKKTDIKLSLNYLLSALDLTVGWTFKRERIKDSLKTI